MRSLLSSVKDRLRPAPTQKVPALPPRRHPALARTKGPHHDRIAAAGELPDGTLADDALLDAIGAEVAARRYAATMEDGPAPPQTSGLRIRRKGLPDWWEASGSLMLAAADAPTPPFVLATASVERMVLVIGSGALPPQLNLFGSDALVVIGDRVVLPASAMSAGDSATILIGEETRCTAMVLADVRNAGVLIFGRDCMLTGGTSFLSDDTHAIRDAASGRRLNKRGGRILIDEHVWIGEQARMMGDVRIGRGSVVDTTAFVKDARFAPNSLVTGRPARATRTDIVWTLDRDD